MNVPVNIISDLSKKDIHINIRIIIRAKSNSVDSPTTYSPNDIFISKNPTFINQKEYNSILLKEPYFKTSISMDKKFKSSTATFTISNLEFKGRVFSDYASNVSMLNKEVDIWYDTQSTKDSETSLLVYRGFISRFKHDKNQCEINLEDINIKKYQKAIPQNKVSEQLNTKYVNKPIPIVYGYLKEAPTVIENGIIKADSDPVNLITALIGEYYNGGNGSTTSHYEGLGVFEGYGHNDSMRAKSPLSIYMNDMTLPVLKRQVFEQYADESNTGFNELQWTKTYDVDGQIKLYNLETNVNGVLQCQYIAKPHTISCINKSDDDSAEGYVDYHWLEYVNDSIETSQGFGGGEQFLEDYKNSLVDNIIDEYSQGLDYFTDSVPGGNFNWSFYGGAENDFADALLNANININLIRLQYLYDPSFSIERYSDWHYLAINNTVMPRVYNIDATTGVKSVFICPQLSTSSAGQTALQQAVNTFQSITFRPSPSILPLDGAIGDHVSYLNQGDDYSHTLKDLFRFTDLETDADYSGYTSPNYPNNWKPIEITNFSHSLEAPSDTDYPAQPYVLLAPNVYGVGNICFGVHGHVTNNIGSLNNIDVSMEVEGHLNELTTYSIIEVSETQDKDFFLDVAGRASIIEGSSNATLTNVIEIIRDIAIREMELDESQINNNPQSTGYIGTAIDNNDINVAFSVNKETTNKKLIEELSSHTLSFPCFASDGTMSFPTIKEQYTVLDDYSMATAINNKDIIKYSFNLSPIEKVYTGVNVEYKHNYKTNKPDLRSDFEYEFNEIYGQDPFGFVFEAFTFSRKNAMSPHEYEYYGYSSAYDNKLDFKSKYITTADSALKLQERLFEYNKNQHLELEIELPLKYINLEIGSLIKFEELIDDVKAYGQNYTKISNPLWMHNEATSLTFYGQFYYPLFFVTSISKNSKSIKIKATRLHCLKSGYVNIDNWISLGLLDEEQVYSYGDYGDESINVDLGYIEQEQEEEVPEIEGCMDSSAENYNPDATIHVAGSCVYAEPEPDDEPEQPYTYPDYTEHVGVRLLERYTVPAIPNGGAPEQDILYAYGDDETLGHWQHRKYSHKFLPIKDVYMHQDLEHHFSEYQLSTIQNNYGMDFMVDIPQFYQEYMDSTDDSSLINFRNEFVHPNKNFNIGSHYNPETNEFNATGWGWKNTYEQMFETYYYSNTGGINYNAFFGHAGWGNAQNNTDEFWRRFVAMEIQIKDYRIYEFAGIGGIGVSGDYDTANETLDAFIDAMPPTLPDWILNDYQGKITLALIVKNRHPQTNLNIGNVELGWKIFPGHYDSPDEYMHNYYTFYNEWGQWVFNSEEDIGWGYIFPGNETWKNAFNFLYGGGLGDVNYQLFNLNSIFSAGGHSPEHQWMRISLIESMGNSYHSVNNGVYDLIYDVQEDNWPFGMMAVTIPSKFGIYDENMQSSIVYPTLEEYAHDPQVGVPGDIDLDGSLNVLDIVAIVNTVLGSGSDASPGDGDYNQDGTVNILDIVGIVDTILGANDND